LCFVPNAINKLIHQIVNPTPTQGIPRENIEASYKANEPDVIIDNIFKLKGHEDDILAGDVDFVECERGTSKDHPSGLLYKSLMPDKPNFYAYLQEEGRSLSPEARWGLLVHPGHLPVQVQGAARLY